MRATGWDTRLLRWRLETLLAGVDDLKAEWEATGEMVRYRYDRRAGSGVEPEPWEILADVEQVMRNCTPIPHATPRVEDITTLLELIDSAEDAYQRLIGEHIEYAEAVLTAHIRTNTQTAGP